MLSILSRYKKMPSMSTFWYPRVSTTLLCVPVLLLGCQCWLISISEDELSGDPSYSDTFTAGDTELAALSRALDDLYQRRRSPGALLPAQAFGPTSWHEHFGVDVGDVPSFPLAINEILSGPCPFWRGRQVRDTHVLVLVPSTVNGAPFTLDKLGELIRPRFPANEADYRYYGSTTKAQLGSVSPLAPCWVLLTRDVIPDSRSKSYEEQKKLLADCVSETGLDYCLPSALVASTAVLAHYVRSGERLFSDAPPTYTRCQDLVASPWFLGGTCYPAVVGGFASAGLDVTYDSVDNVHGVSACREFF